MSPLKPRELRAPNSPGALESGPSQTHIEAKTVTKAKTKLIWGTKSDRSNQKMLREMINSIAKEKRKKGEDYSAGLAQIALVHFFDDLSATFDWLFLKMSVEELSMKYGRSALAIEESLRFFTLPVAEWLRKTGQHKEYFK
jgi:hypothetical protein